MTISEATFAYVRDLVLGESAISLGADKQYLVEARLAPLAREAGAPDVDSFISDLRTATSAPIAVTKSVVEALTTNETSWFRDSEPFHALRQTVFPSLAQSRAATRRLRVWSAACSTGQEPFSIAMTALDTPALAGWQTDIVATDLSEQVLDRARSGLYTNIEVNRGLPAPQLVKHFTRNGTDWKVNDQLARMVTFRYLNLIRPFPYMGTFDIVFCRNVLIYFDIAAKREVLRRIRDVIAPDGYLFLGAAETLMGVDEDWERVPTSRCSVYQRKKAGS